LRGETDHKKQENNSDCLRGVLVLYYFLFRECGVHFYCIILVRVSSEKERLSKGVVERGVLVIAWMVVLCCVVYCTCSVLQGGCGVVESECSRMQVVVV
jgi:hypothetical protein